MFPAILLAVSVVALIQFTVYYWRAIVAGVAAKPLSNLILTAAGLTDESLGSADFEAILNVHELTPCLKTGQGRLQAVRAYYRVAQALGRVLPQLAAWTEREMATCSRYVAVLVDQRMERNLACAAEMRAC